MNHVILAGRITRSFGMNATLIGNDAKSVEVETPDGLFILVAAFSELARYLDSLPIGSSVLVQGQILSYNYMSKGKRKTKTEVRAKQITSIDSLVGTMPAARKEHVA